MNIFDFMAAHPWLTVFLVLTVCCTVFAMWESYMEAMGRTRQATRVVANYTFNGEVDERIAKQISEVSARDNGRNA